MPLFAQAPAGVAVSGRGMMTSGSFVIPADHRALPGHFPGNPVVPGVVLLDHALGVLARQVPDLRVNGMRHVKFPGAGSGGRGDCCGFQAGCRPRPGIQLHTARRHGADRRAGGLGTSDRGGRLTWAGQRERGNFRLLQLAFWIIRTAGWHAGQALLYPITLYFFIASPGARASSRDYLSRVLDRPVRARDIMRHFFTFACVLLDRIFFLGGRTEAYRIEEHGVEALTALLAQGRGAVLLGAHLGSFDMLRAFGRKSPVPVNPVMFRSPGGVFSRLMETLDPDMARRVIDLAAPGAMLKVQECIGRGEIVGFLGDRTPGPQRVVSMDFLGGEADFPTGPLVMASVLRAPVVLFYGVRTGARRYAVRFEPFADSIALRRPSREADVRRWMQLYAESLAAACRAYPFNWFNFFPFWQAGKSGRADAPGPAPLGARGGGDAGAWLRRGCGGAGARRFGPGSCHHGAAGGTSGQARRFHGRKTYRQPGGAVAEPGRFEFPPSCDTGKTDADAAARNHGDQRWGVEHHDAGWAA